MPLALPVWRSFLSLASSSEAASLSACCNYSLSTLDVICRNPGVANFALTEQKHLDKWRWAIFNTDGSILSTGWEATQQKAHQAAEQALLSTQPGSPHSIEEGIF